MVGFRFSDYNVKNLPTVDEMKVFIENFDEWTPKLSTST